MSRAVVLLIALTTFISIHFSRKISSGLTVDLATFREAELQRHNAYREKHGTPSLILNDTLNAAAQAYADHLEATHHWQHSPAAKKGKYGESIYWGWGTYYLIYPLGTASDTWYRESIHYDYVTGDSIPPGSMVSHFTAMIWKEVTSVGFGFSSGKENGGKAIFVVANYSPTPNIQGKYQENVPRPV